MRWACLLRVLGMLLLDDEMGRDTTIRCTTGRVERLSTNMVFGAGGFVLGGGFVTDSLIAVCMMTDTT